MRDLIKLIKKIDKVIALFLCQKKIGVTTDILQLSTVGTILSNLNGNINYYKNIAAQPSDAPQSTFWRATKTVISSVQYLYQTTESMVRYITNTDSRYRLDTIAWLYWSRQHFSTMAEQAGKLNTVTDLRLYADNLKIEIRAFFRVINRILDDTPPTLESAFLVERQDKKFLIYGLKDSPSELAVWFRQYLVEKFRTPALIESIMDECRNKCEIIVARTEQQSLIAEHRAPLMAAIKKLQENNAALERELAYTNRLAGQYQSELQDSQARTANILQDLTLKESQERAYEESIKRLTLEKETIELRQQTQRTVDPRQNELLRAEIETMRRRLEVATRDKEVTLAEKNKLAAAVQTERQQQEELRKQLERVNQEKEDLAKEMPPVVEDVASLDEQAIAKILEPYSQPEEPEVNEDQLYDEEGDDEIDLARLVARLQEHAQASELEEEAKNKFPLLVDEVKNGLSDAQYYVLDGDIKFLASKLRKNPDAVNTICRATTNPLSNKTLLKLAMFHVSTLMVRRKTRKSIVELILKFRPTITNRNLCVFDIIKNRLTNNDKCDLEIRELFCQYAIAQKTCTSECRAELVSMMEKVEASCAHLLAKPHAILVEGHRCDSLLQELDESIRICRLLRQAYIEGNFSVLDNIIRRETPVDYPELQEILYDLPMKAKADDEYKRRHGRTSLRACLLDVMAPRIVARHAIKLAKSVEAQRDDTVIQLDDAESLVQNKLISIAKQPFDPAYEQELIAYGDLLMNLSRILVLYGVVLSAKGFNPYQVGEIQLQRSLELEATSENAQQVHQQYSSKAI